MVRQPVTAAKKAGVTVRILAPDLSDEKPYTIKVDGAEYTPPASSVGGAIEVQSVPGGKILMPKPAPSEMAFMSMQRVEIDGISAFYGEDSEMRDYEYTIPEGHPEIEVTAYVMDEDFGMPTYVMEVYTKRM